jgi:hypothetical protein
LLVSDPDAQTAINAMALGLSATGIGAIFGGLLKLTSELAPKGHWTLSAANASQSDMALALALARLSSGSTLGQIGMANVVAPEDTKRPAIVYNYLRLRAGELPSPPGADTSTLDLLHPCDGPFGTVVCTPDPADPLSGANFWSNVYFGDASQVKPEQVWSVGLSTPGLAKRTLIALRAAVANGTLKPEIDRLVQTPHGPGSWQLPPYEVLRAQVGYARAMAGETEDDADLARFFGGPVTPVPHAFRGTVNPDGTVTVSPQDLPQPAPARATRVPPSASPSVGWLPVGVVLAASAAVVGFVWKTTGRLRGAGRVNVSRALPRAPAPVWTSDAIYARILAQGIRDDELTFSRYNVGPSLKYLKAISDAYFRHGISPTDVASSGLYLPGQDPFPIRIEVSDGVAYLKDADRLREGAQVYLAARAKGARAILATVAKVMDGEVQDERTAVVRLL